MEDNGRVNDETKQVLGRIQACETWPVAVDQGYSQPWGDVNHDSRNSTTPEHDDDDEPFALLEVDGTRAYKTHTMFRAALQPLQPRSHPSSSVNIPSQDTRSRGKGYQRSRQQTQVNPILHAPLLGMSTDEDIQSGTITGLPAMQNEDTEHSPQVLISVSRAPQTQETPVQLGRFTCDRCEEARACWKKPSKRDDHTKLCRGKCRNCRESNIPCKGLGNSCVACGERGVICDDFSHALLIKKSTMLCERCGILKSYTGLVNKSHHKAHVQSCKGKCENCQEANIPCEKKGNSKACSLCRQKGLVCENFSHEASLPRITCERCGIQAAWSDAHFRTCRGKCANCRDRSIVCEKRPWGNPCKSCTENNCNAEITRTSQR
jgi:hypothetical protein